MYTYQAGKSVMKEVFISFSKIPLWYQLQLSNGGEKFTNSNFVFQFVNIEVIRTVWKSKRYDKGRQAVQCTV